MRGAIMGKNVQDYIERLEYVKGLGNIMTVEHRSNNPKRDYLFCNKMQGKHIPVSPSAAFDIFDELAYMVDKKLRDKKVVVVGFAETATAIGGYMASHVDSCVYHLQTSREDCNPISRLIEFSEEHSHATEQYLYGELDAMPDFDYILFVEDEISTGKTIINFINEFNRVIPGLSFGVASICNWQDEKNKAIYDELGIDTFALIRGELRDVNAKMDVEIEETAMEYAGVLYDADAELAARNVVNLGTGIPFFIERTGRVPNSPEVHNVVRSSTAKCIDFLGNCNDVLVLGTEEFMYVPMLVGEKLEEWGYRVNTHATTRSSIDIMKDNDGDIKEGLVRKFKLHSAYDVNRVTYVYNLQKYDKVVVITDSNTTDEFVKDIVSALESVGNKEANIMILNLEK